MVLVLMKITTILQAAQGAQGAAEMALALDMAESAQAAQQAQLTQEAVAVEVQETTPRILHTPVVLASLLSAGEIGQPQEVQTNAIRSSKK